MNVSREDYLKIIHSANLTGSKVTNKYIAQQLGISAPSVSEMISKLIDSGKIIKSDSLGYELTEDGRQEAENLIRKHRLWEVFLVNYLGYSWDAVHDDAEILEHATSDELATRLSAFLNDPEACPHGSAIYGNVKTPVEKIRISLASLKEGEMGVIREVSDHKKFLNYMVTKGISIHDNVQVLSIDDYDGTRTLKIKDQIIEVSAQAVEEICVELV